RLNTSLEVARGLDAALDGSWASLDANAQRALARCTVFRAPFTADAAEAVTGASVDVIAVLREKSLLFAREDLAHDVRLGMYAPVRDYAARKLEPAERALADARHAAWFLGIAGKQTRARLVAERAELLAIVQAALGEGPITPRAAEPALRALLALAPL